MGCCEQEGRASPALSMVQEVPQGHAVLLQGAADLSEGSPGAGTHSVLDGGS